MKIYEFGDAGKPVIMLFPGTCCYWKTNFGHVLPNLQKYFYTAVVSYSGFDETENTTFVSRESCPANLLSAAQADRHSF